MSQETGFKLLSETSFLKNQECEPFSISGNSSADCSSQKPEVNLEDGELLPNELKAVFDFSNLVSKPLEEIDSNFYRKQTFLAIGWDWTVGRFSGSRSAFILNPLKPLRRVGIYLLSQWHLPVLIGISLALLCLSLVLPNYPYDSASFIRYLVSFVLLAEISINVLARGVLVDEFTYLRSPWHWLDVVVWAVVFLSNYLERPVLHSLQGVVLLKFIPLFPALKRNGFRIAIKTLKNLVPALIYSLIVVWILVVFGLRISILDAERYGSVWTPCTSNSTSVLDLGNNSFRNRKSETVKNDSDNNAWNSASDCPNGPETFASLYTGFLRSFELVTLSFFGGLPYEIHPLNQSFLYILLSLTVGSFVIGVFTTASVLDSFLGQPPKTCINKATTFDICTRLRSKLQTLRCDCSALKAINDVFYHPIFELLVTAVIMLDIMLLTLLAVNRKDAYGSFVESVVHQGEQVCMGFYVMESTLKLLTSPFRYMRNRWALLDIFVVGIYILDKSVSASLAWVLVIRVFKITPRWPTLYTMIKIIFSSLTHRFGMACVMCIFIFIYLIGVRQLTTGSAELIASPFVYLFKNWALIFQTCSSNSKPHFCILILVLEVTLAVVFVTVSFAAVIHSSYETLRNPIDFPENYKNLVKAFELIKSKCPLKGFCSTNAKDSRPTEALSSNGGPKVLQELPLGCNSEASEIVQDDSDKYAKAVEWISLVVISVATVGSVVDFGTSLLSSPRFWIDSTFVIYFFVCLLWETVTKGWRMFKNTCWLLDLLIVSASGFLLCVAMRRNSSLNELPIMKGITALASCKGLLLIFRLQWTRVAAIGILNELGTLWRYLFVSFFVFMCFLVLKIRLPAEIDALLSQNTALNDTLKKDSVQQSRFSSSCSLPFLILIGGILFGVILFHMMRNNLLNSFMTTAQLTTYKLTQEKTVIIPYPKRRICMQIIHYVTLTDAFNLTFMGFILCDCLVITLSPFATSKDWKIVWSNYPVFIVGLYLFELVVKMFGWRKHFFKSTWNIYDLIVVAVGFVDIFLIKVQIGFITASIIRFLRILRVFQLKPLLRKTKLIQIFYTALIRISPVLGNLLLLYLIFLYSYATIGVVNSKTSPQGLINAFQMFKNMSVSLILIPFYPDVHQYNLKALKDGNAIAQAPSCWEGYEDFLRTLYLCSYLVMSYAIVTNLYAIYLSEILKEVDKDFNYSTCSNANKGTCYKHTNGLLKLVRSPEDLISMETMLTPIDNTNLVEDEPLNDEERYPQQISANGYIIHVEALVSTV